MLFFLLFLVSVCWSLCAGQQISVSKILEGANRVDTERFDFAFCNYCDLGKSNLFLKILKTWGASLPV